MNAKESMVSNMYMYSLLEMAGQDHIGSTYHTFLIIAASSESQCTSKQNCSKGESFLSLIYTADIVVSYMFILAGGCKTAAYSSFTSATRDNSSMTCRIVIRCFGFTTSMAATSLSTLLLWSKRDFASRMSLSQSCIF